MDPDLASALIYGSVIIGVIAVAISITSFLRKPQCKCPDCIEARRRE